MINYTFENLKGLKRLIFKLTSVSKEDINVRWSDFYI
uniref:Uncharacterized protein n=1 Tax=Siphoviridae sp. ct3gT1 TaxID=2825323 RepID=A0A8S5UJP2_9CAUD|nr:MAG TPA: hypothetical protein [Siphoviridae sp. ct3gT1]